MDKEKEIEEMACTIRDSHYVLRDVERPMKIYEKIAKQLYKAGYRKTGDLRIHEMQMKNGEIDMTLESPDCIAFIWSIIQIFRQNGGKNFVTTTIEVSNKEGGERYSLTIQKVGGQTPAEKLIELEQSRKQAVKEIAEKLKEKLTAIPDGKNEEEILSKIEVCMKVENYIDELIKELYGEEK